MVLVRLILLVLTMAFAGAPDALGNMRVRTEGTTSVSTMNYADGTNRVTSATIFGQNRTFSYDARGNVTNNGKYSFAYDFANQPVSQTGTVNATYAYDGNFKRVKEVSGGKTIYNIYSRLTGALLYRDQATDVVKTDYVSVGGAALRLKKTGTGAPVPEYVHFDLQGSAVAASDAAGAVLWRESYRPYGRSRLDPPANDNNTGYTGHLKDSASGLVYMQARYYDPLIGRFLSTDPIGYQDQLNLYAYVANDPVNNFDPNGESAKKTFFKSAAQSLRSAAEARQIKNARARGRNAALRNERQQLQDTGESPSNLSPERQQELLDTGKLKNMDGHHEPSISSGSTVDEKVAIAENPDNIKFMEKDAHQQVHSDAGGTQVPITGGHDAVTVGLTGLAIAAEVISNIPDPVSAFQDTLMSSTACPEMECGPKN